MLQISAEDRGWVESTWEKLTLKMSAQCDRLGGSIPYSAANGKYTAKMTDSMNENIFWWTNGFWPGMLWLMYDATKDEKYLKTARAVEEKLDAAFSGFEGLQHDVGFMWTLASVLDWRITGDERARIRALHAANILAGRFNPRGRFIRSWNRDCTGWVIIDSMMNLSILFWACDQMNDPRFKFIAEDHADTVMQYLVRGDSSCHHIAVLNPHNGALFETPVGQGYISGSSWTRGQAWALYGFAITYRHTGEIRYLEAARRIAQYFREEVSRFGFVPPADFRAPHDSVKIIDTSAGSIAACGLLTLADISTPSGSQADVENIYLQNAMNILKATEAAHCDWDTSTDGIVKNATAQFHGKLDERHVPLIYGDYFFLEAVNRLRGADIQIW